ncbi:MAG TPA: HAMP domain-containing sensor histidine kinase [Elusimicrobiota bacterium]|nr:HAMP domain-containing sensor histidine kinase [Elusimicrobiota bacterium]
MYIPLSLYHLLRGSAADQPGMNQMRYVFAAYLIAFGGGVQTFLLAFGIPMMPYAICLVPIGLALIWHAIATRKMMDFDVAIRKTFIYSVLAAALTAVYVGVAVSLAAIVQSRLLGSPSPFSYAAAAIAITLLFDPFRRRIQQWVDRRFPRESLNQTMLREATGNFVHEIKRPLVNISMPIQLAMADLKRLNPRDPPQSEVLESLRERLAFVLRQTHDAAEKIEAIQALATDDESPGDNIDLAEVFERALTNEADRLQSAGVRVQADVNGVCIIKGDRHQLEIALANVIRNAADAMLDQPAGRRLLCCNLHRKSTSIALCISDTGPGIGPQELGRLFEPWFTTKGSRGMGIGLYLAREIIQRHGGSVEVASAPGQGTTFRIDLPAVASSG